MAYKVVSRSPTAKDLAAIVAAKLGDKNVAKQAVEATVAAFQEMLTTYGCIHLPGFGRFYLQRVASRNGRNPRTGERITIPMCKRAGFHMSKTWKRKVNIQSTLNEKE